MTGFYTSIVLNHSILLPAVAGMVRVKRIDSFYHPFLIFIWLGLLNETLSLILIYTIRTNTVNSNLYVLLEYMVLMYQFYIWNEERSNKFLLFSTVGLAVWITDNFIIHSLSDYNSLFRSLYPVGIIFCSIDTINRLIILDRKSILRNSTFLICTIFLFYYGYKSFYEAINIFDLRFSDVFYRHLELILSVINCISNLFYTVAVLWMPRKQAFIMLY